MVRVAWENDVFHAVADPTRRRVLDLLAKRDHPAMELVKHFNMSQPSVSEHLRLLREAGLVRSQKSGRQRIYSLNPMPLKELADWVALFDRFWEQKMEALGDYLAGAASAQPMRIPPMNMEID